ncbi:MAG: methyltransferase type 11 [Bacteroidetes bacterium]|nr:MAG: methyltransferase type 11 [Bacteroidota bacterium]
MQYDPIKRSLGLFFNRTPFLRKLFYRLLDALLLRTWHVRGELKEWARQNPGPKMILDAGSGFGQYSYYMASHFKNKLVTGVDVKQEQIDDCLDFFCKARLTNATFTYADLTQYVTPENYDLILSVDVMEHIEDDVAVFKNFHASLKEGGMLLISTPSDQGGSDVHEHEHSHDGANSFIDEHVRDGYNIREIQEKLKEAGFSHTQARFQYGTPGKISWKLSMKYPILMLNASKLFFILLPFYYLITFPWSLLLNYLDVKRDHETGSGLIVIAKK